MRILGVDPGPAYTGWAVLEDGETKKVGELKGVEFIDNLKAFLQEEEIDVVALEDYVARPRAWGKEKAWVRHDTLEIIGGIKTECRRANVKVVMQLPAIKASGYGWAFKTLRYVKGKPGMHKYDAVAHAYYLGVKQYGWQPKS